MIPSSSIDSLHFLFSFFFKLFACHEQPSLQNHTITQFHSVYIFCLLFDGLKIETVRFIFMLFAKVIFPQEEEYFLTKTVNDSLIGSLE